MDNTKNTRKKILKISAATSFFLLTGINWVKRVYGEAVATRTARLRNTYIRDTQMQYRKSQDNPAVQTLYREFLQRPGSHKAHHLLHTEYTDRSNAVKELRQKEHN